MHIPRNWLAFISAEEHFLSKIRANQTLFRMLLSRGYAVPQKKIDETIEDLSKMVGNE